MRGGRGVTFDAVVFRNMGAAALNITDGSQDITVENSIFQYISGNAIGLGQIDDWQETDPERQNARLTVRNCSLLNITQEFAGSVGIFAGFIRDSVITATTIDSPAKACVSLGWGWGTASPSYMRNNSVTRVLCLRGNSECCGGMGVMYTLGAQSGTTLANNYIRDAARVWAGVGFHHDEGSQGIVDYANVVFNAPALEKIHVTYRNHNLSDPMTKDINVTGCWTNTHPVADHASGPPGLITFQGNLFVNTTRGERWPRAALDVMRGAGFQPQKSDDEDEGGVAPPTNIAFMLSDDLGFADVSIATGVKAFYPHLKRDKDLRSRFLRDLDDTSVRGPLPWQRRWKSDDGATKASIGLSADGAVDVDIWAELGARDRPGRIPPSGRGVGDGKAQLAGDMRLLRGLSWWYDWGLTPYDTVTPPGMEFVAMVWGKQHKGQPLAGRLAE
jgi:hypothetical protein